MLPEAPVCYAVPVGRPSGMRTETSTRRSNRRQRGRHDVLPIERLPLGFDGQIRSAWTKASDVIVNSIICWMFSHLNYQHKMSFHPVTVPCLFDTTLPVDLGEFVITLHCIRATSISITLSVQEWSRRSTHRTQIRPTCLQSRRSAPLEWTSVRYREGINIDEWQHSKTS